MSATFLPLYATLRKFLTAHDDESQGKTGVLNMLVPLSNPNALLLRACTRKRYTVPRVKLPKVVDSDVMLAAGISLLVNVTEPFGATVTEAINTRYRRLLLKYEDAEGGGVHANVMLVSVVAVTLNDDTLPG